MANETTVKANDMSDEFIKKDRMRYVKNKLSGNLAVLSIILNALFFISIYKSNVGQYYYKPLIGGSIVYNLLFMMIVFLVSEGSKNYQINYSYIAAVRKDINLSHDGTQGNHTYHGNGRAGYEGRSVYPPCDLSGGLGCMSASFGCYRNHQVQQSEEAY